MKLWALFRRSRSQPRKDLTDWACKPACRSLRSFYDAASTTDENMRHWQMADALSADAAMSPSVRRTLRMRARYEVANNCYAKGIVLTIAYHTVGTGPRLQIAAEGGEEIENIWNDWAEAVGLGHKLRTMIHARVVDGEAFAMMVTNHFSPHPVKLDLRLLEADQVADPFMPFPEPNRVDGIKLNPFHEPVEYYVLREHPGGLFPNVSLKADVVPARYMLHLFRRDRPDQSRGVPEIAPALPLFAQLRAYTSATIGAAENAAAFSLFLKTQTCPDTGPELGMPFSSLDIERRMMVQLPAGVEPFQPKAEQPAATYEMFKREILNEIARCVSLPYNIAACNSSAYNYASGRLDHQTYFKTIAVDRHHLQVSVLNRLLREWYAEASQLYHWVVPLGTFRWVFDKQTDIDPETEANARLLRMAAGSSPTTEFAEIGVDWDQELAASAKAYGVSVADYQALLRKRIFGSDVSFNSEDLKDALST